MTREEQTRSSVTKKTHQSVLSFFFSSSASLGSSPLFHECAFARTSSRSNTIAPTDSNRAVSVNRRRISFRLRRKITPRAEAVAKALRIDSSLEIRFGELLKGDRTNSDHDVGVSCCNQRAGSSRPAVLCRPFLDLVGGAGKPFRNAVLSSSASVPLSLDARAEFLVHPWRRA